MNETTKIIIAVMTGYALGMAISSWILIYEVFIK